MMKGETYSRFIKSTFMLDKLNMQIDGGNNMKMHILKGHVSIL